MAELGGDIEVLAMRCCCILVVLVVLRNLVDCNCSMALGLECVKRCDTSI